MIIKLKNADFSANNVGKIYIPGMNVNVGEGTTNPLLFKYTNTTGSGEFLGVDFITKENPTVFPIIRKLHKGGTGVFLYSYLTPQRTSINFPLTPKCLSMAVWINKTAWEKFQKTSSMSIFLQVYDRTWKFINGSGDYNPLAVSYEELSFTGERTQDITSTYMSASVKRKILQTRVVNGETWVCIGIVFYNLVFNTSTYEANCRPRIAMQFSFMNSTTYDMEVGNLQVVESVDYLNPDKEY